MDAKAFGEGFSRGFDRGNYGNAYEPQDWNSWWADNCDANSAPEYAEGALLGFFSTYEIHEISDDVIAEAVAELRNKYPAESA